MTRVDDLMARELERFRAEHPRSLELAEQARQTLLGGVPMHWMTRWPGGFPVPGGGVFERRRSCG